MAGVMIGRRASISSRGAVLEHQRVQRHSYARVVFEVWMREGHEQRDAVV